MEETAREEDLLCESIIKVHKCDLRTMGWWKSGQSLTVAVLAAKSQKKGVAVKERETISR